MILKRALPTPRWLPATDMSKSRTLRVVVYALLIFLGGAITGAFVAPRIGRTFIRPPNVREMSHHMMERLESGLQLTSQQAAQITPIIERTTADLEEIHSATTRRVQKRVAETNQEISAILTPEQQKKFTQMEEEHRNRMRYHHPFAEPPGPPPPPPAP
jgi:hypothetical protein